LRGARVTDAGERFPSHEVIMKSLRSLLSRVAAAAISLSATAAEPASAANEESTDDAFTGEAGGQPLAAFLAALPGIAATHVACEWALSPVRERRLALATSLEFAFRLVGDDVMIDHLARDDDPAIRRAAARAAWARRASGGDAGVLGRLVDDPDPSVREVAELAAVGR
jgi:hypothetical protein